jgi:hypothetical protein
VLIFQFSITPFHNDGVVNGCGSTLFQQGKSSSELFVAGFHACHCRFHALCNLCLPQSSCHLRPLLEAAGVLLVVLNPIGQEMEQFDLVIGRRMFNSMVMGVFGEFMGVTMSMIVGMFMKMLVRGSLLLE